MSEFVLVPVEPTPEMLGILTAETARKVSWVAGYKAMLAAAPQPEIGPAGSADRYFFERGVEQGKRWIQQDYIDLHNKLEEERVLHDITEGDVTKLKAEIERLKQFEAAYMEWCDKSEWIIRRSIAETKDLGKHLADIVREKFERLGEEVERLNNALEVEKRSVENEVKRRNQYARESDKLDAEAERLTKAYEEKWTAFCSLNAKYDAAFAELTAIRAMCTSIENREWADHFATGETSSRVEAAFSQLYNDWSALTNSNKACEDCFIEMRAERDALKSEAQFLIERLNSLEFTDMDDLVRDWYGHVFPSLSRLQELTAKPDDVCPLCNGDCSAANPPVTNCPLDASAKPEVDHE